MNTVWDQRFLSLAQLVASWSKDPSTQVGAVIVDSNRRIVSTGYNGFPQGVMDLPERLNNRDIKLDMIVHAEINAILFAQRDLKNCILYTWPFQPCSRCAAILIQTGIQRVVAPVCDNTRWAESFALSARMFSEAGVTLDLI